MLSELLVLKSGTWGQFSFTYASLSSFKMHWLNVGACLLTCIKFNSVLSNWHYFNHLVYFLASLCYVRNNCVIMNGFYPNTIIPNCMILYFFSLNIMPDSFQVCTVDFDLVLLQMWRWLMETKPRALWSLSEE